MGRVELLAKHTRERLLFQLRRAVEHGAEYCGWLRAAGEDGAHGDKVDSSHRRRKPSAPAGRHPSSGHHQQRQVREREQSLAGGWVERRGVRLAERYVE
eukprot:scaffold149189_cov21-Tisochrysis_lutea.AAC.1